MVMSHHPNSMWCCLVADFNVMFSGGDGVDLTPSNLQVMLSAGDGGDAQFQRDLVVVVVMSHHQISM